MIAFFNDPDSDWMTICDECEYCIEYDFTVSDYALDWTPAYVPVTSAVTGLWVDAVGYQHRDYQEDNSNDAFTRAVGLTGLRDWSTATFHKFVVEYTWVYGNSILSNTHAALSSPTGVIKLVTFVNRPANGGVVWTVEEDASPAELRLLVRSSVAQSATYSGSVTVTKIRIYGSGEIPEHGGELC